MGDSIPPPLPDDYPTLLAALKERIRAARLRAAVAVNQELVLLYWSVGRDILARMSVEGWGAKVVQRLARDLKRDFPEMTGLSAAQPDLHAGVRRGLSRPEHCATGCCTIALGS